MQQWGATMTTDVTRESSFTRHAPKIGWAMSGLFALFMLGASVTPKLAAMPVAEETMAALGWPAGYTVPIGLAELVFTILFLIPRTALLGAVLLTGLLGGAMATHMRIESPLLSHTLFSLYLGILLWGGLWLRDAGLRRHLPFRR